VSTVLNAPTSVSEWTDPVWEYAADMLVGVSTLRDSVGDPRLEFH